jgi:uncharacterized protein DUF5946
MSSAGRTACSGCGGVFPDVQRPVHAYVSSSPGCWKTFGEVQADEMQRFGHPNAHGLVVDAYVAQHRGGGVDRRDRQSVFVHLIGLAARLEDGVPTDAVSDLLRRVLAQRCAFPALRRRHGAARLTLLHMIRASDLADYERRAREWATAVWESWSPEHERIRLALQAAAKTR